MSEADKAVEHKVKRMEQEYQDLVIRTEYLRASKEKIRQDIQFYKSVISKLAFTYDIAPQ